jgi:Na+/proline symporter
MKFGNLTTIDLSVILLFFAVIIGISIYYTRKAGSNMQQFFLSGRNLPWYMAGTAMVATTFAADTPLAVTELIAKNGVAGNWLWWNMAIGGLLTVFFFAKLWRRAGIMTDLELIEFRYSGKPAAALRGFRAIYLGLFMNVIVLGWVHKAMEKIFLITLPGYDPFLLVVILAIIISVYASASGLLGTVRTDSFQFVFAMSGCIVLAVLVVKLPAIGGMVALKENLSPEMLNFFPIISKGSGVNLAGGALALSAGAFLAYVGVQWWSSWYPGADPGGGGYIAQRMMSAKDEKHSLLATLWFNIAHYTLRPWPWIIVALCALILLPRASEPELIERENPVMYKQVVEAYDSRELAKTTDHSGYDTEFLAMYEKYENTIDPGVMYPKLMVRYLPIGILGLLIAVFMAAYMSTIASQLNWGTSYLINDFYKRFIRNNASEKHYVLVSRLGIVLMVVFSLVVTNYFLTTIKGAWEFIINASAGMGAVLILRWYWSRINAWSEISAMIAPLLIYPFSVYVLKLESPLTLYPTVLGTTFIWLTITFLTPPVSETTLHKFYKKVRPGGIGWKSIRQRFPDIEVESQFGRNAINWVCGLVCIYATMYGTGKILFHEYSKGFMAIGITLVSGLIIYRNLKQGE